jgi:methenyltetrahydromethanopterin cyclohydrolase
MTLNEQANALADQIAAGASELRVAVQTVGGARVIDMGVAAPGGLVAGRALASVCVAGRAGVSIVPGALADVPGPAVQVHSDDPVRACMASQYAGWQVSVGKFFAMGSGPMRALYAKEPLFGELGLAESAPVAVGVLETRKLPAEEVISYFTERLKLPAERLTLLCAPASSLAGAIQVVARSVETALHKLHELKFDIRQVLSGHGVAPLPPVAADEIGAIGRTNDAILYGGQVTLYVRAEDEVLAEVGPKVPSSASRDHGVPFAEVFERAGRDFYKIDPHLFSPAEIALVNLKTGRQHVFGRMEPAVLRKSFGG